MSMTDQITNILRTLDTGQYAFGASVASVIRSQAAIIEKKDRELEGAKGISDEWKSIADEGMVKLAKVALERNDALAQVKSMREALTTVLVRGYVSGGDLATITLCDQIRALTQSPPKV